jgi:DNA repair photolyase
VTLRPVSNPPNPWLSTEVEYLDEIPEARLEVIEDSSRSILAHNDSPDVGFDWSVNPYRGCQHACAYCASGDTRVLKADGSVAQLRDLRVRDAIYGTRRSGHYRRYVRTQVLAHWKTVKAAHRIRLEDGTELVTSGDHRFLTSRGWKYVTPGDRQRPHLTTNDELRGFGLLPAAPAETDEYRRGYLCGMIRGDALLGVFRYQREGRAHGDQYQFRLALADLEALRRTRAYLDQVGIATHQFEFAAATAERRAMTAIRTNARGHFEQIRQMVAWPDEPTVEWERGFLAGIFDAEGSCSGVIRISNTDQRIIDEVVRCLRKNGFDCVVEPPRASAVAANVRIRGGLRARLRFFQWAQPAITRKRDIDGLAIKCDAKLRVTEVTPLGFDMLMYDITTGTGDFIAEGVVSHNCYARPSHEYLSMGAGTDFDRKIVVKPEAPRLLREAFEKKSWQGELVVFSGVTDCYQPLEASYRLTRGCLEVCAEYANPVGIITKAPLIERDLDVLTKLASVTRVSVSVSVPFWNPENARAIEPFVATPERRMKTIARLAQAGIDVGVMCAPMIPALNDQDIPSVLEAAAQAGAKHAGFVFLRLPGSVKAVFEERVRASLPLRADHILSRVRDARGGKLYDSRFGVRGRGEGEYAEQARALFETTARRFGLRTGSADTMGPRREFAPTFRRPEKSGAQLKLLL